MRRYGMRHGRGPITDCFAGFKGGRVHEKRFGEMIAKEHLELLTPHACDGSVGLFCACEESYLGAKPETRAADNETA